MSDPEEAGGVTFMASVVVEVRVMVMFTAGRGNACRCSSGRVRGRVRGKE